MVCLIKPQFEAGKEKVGKKGVVRDPAVHREVLEHFLEHAKENNFTVIDITYSPIRGPEGNIEYLEMCIRDRRYFPWPIGSLIKWSCLMSREIVAWVQVIPISCRRCWSCSCVSMDSRSIISKILD